jgi:hypothetical protein
MFEFLFIFSYLKNIKILQKILKMLENIKI